ncbi:MAG: DUF4271 domain-containing protein [Bacteroidia bacterium]
MLDSQLFIFLNSIRQIGEATVRNASQPLDGLLFLLFLVLAALFAIVRVTSPDLISGLLRGVSSARHSMMLLNDGRLGLRFSTVALDIIYVSCVALLLFRLVGNQSFERLIWLFLLVVVFYLSRIILIIFFRIIFFPSETTNIHLHEILLFNKSLGLALLPLLAASYFTLFGEAELLAIASVLVVIVFIYRLIRIFSLMRTHYTYGNLYFFFYLCTVEITPYLVVFKGFLQPNLISAEII